MPNPGFSAPRLAPRLALRSGRAALPAALAALVAAAPAARAAGDAARPMSLVPGEREPAQTDRPTADALAALRAKITDKPKDREARFHYVRALIRAGKLTDALAAARAWRAIDAYNLVVVRLIGDIYSELGDKPAARRAYSAVVELLPKDASAQRALASVLKQAGDLDGAYERLAAAAELSPKDQRLAFERADVAARLGRADEARTRFQDIVGDANAPRAISYPASQRLAQLDRQLARQAAAAGRADDARSLEGEIAGLHLAGGTENDIKVYLSWDTDKSDVDLWVTNPTGERVYYEHKTGKFGEALYDDVTTGYGPESFTAPHAQRGDYLIQINYFGAGRSNFSEARGEVVVILDEGKPSESRKVLPYRLFAVGQTATVARISVGGSK
jgi:predicted negative regulator of RcsB-dependent stress response